MQKTKVSDPEEAVRLQVYFNPALIEIGFTSKLKFGMRSELRLLCSKFLRFSYLMDFIATDALMNIYLSSVVETIESLKNYLRDLLIFN